MCVCGEHDELERDRATERVIGVCVCVCEIGDGRTYRMEYR